MTETGALIFATWLLVIVFLLVITWQPPKPSDIGLAELDAKVAAKRREWHEQMGVFRDPPPPDIAAPRMVRPASVNPPSIEQLQQRLAAMRADGTAAKPYTETETVGDALEAHIARRMEAG